MSLDITAIRTALATDAASADGITRALAHVPDKITIRDLPLVIVGNPETIEYNRNFTRAHATITFRVTVLVAESLDPAAATELLDGFVSQSSAASASPQPLASALRQLASTDERPWLANVTEMSGYGLFQFESTKYYGAQLVVVVTT